MTFTTFNLDKYPNNEINGNTFSRVEAAEEYCHISQGDGSLHIRTIEKTSSQQKNGLAFSDYENTVLCFMNRSKCWLS